MLSINAVLDYNTITEYNTQANTSCTNAYSINQNGFVLGYCLYDIKNNEVYIENVTIFDNDPILADGLIRAVLSSVNSNGVCTAHFHNVSENYLNVFGQHIQNIDEFFNNGCCKK